VKGLSSVCLKIFGRKLMVKIVVVKNVELEWCSISVVMVMWVSWLF